MPSSATTNLIIREGISTTYTLEPESGVITRVNFLPTLPADPDVRGRVEQLHLGVGYDPVFKDDRQRYHEYQALVDAAERDPKSPLTWTHEIDLWSCLYKPTVLQIRLATFPT